jgi:hypothetical protein
VLGNYEEKTDANRKGENKTLHKQFLWTKDGGFGKAKTVFQLRPLGYGLTGFHRRFEFDLARGKDGILSETVRNSSHDSDTVDLSVREKQNFQNHESLHAYTPCFTSVFWFWLRSDFRFDVDFFRRESGDCRWIEEMCECAVVSAAIVLILFRCH